MGSNAPFPVTPAGQLGRSSAVKSTTPYKAIERLRQAEPAAYPRSGPGSDGCPCGAIYEASLGGPTMGESEALAVYSVDKRADGAGDAVLSVAGDAVDLSGGLWRVTVRWWAEGPAVGPVTIFGASDQIDVSPVDVNSEGWAAGTVTAIVSGSPSLQLLLPSTGWATATVWFEWLRDYVPSGGGET